MKLVRRVRVFLFIAFGSLLWPLPGEAASDPPVIIHEVQITGGTGRADDDFIELYNPTAGHIDVSGYQLQTKNSNGTPNTFPKVPAGTCIAPHGFFLWANKKGAFKESADLVSSDSLAAKYSLALLDRSGSLVDAVSWGGTLHPFDNAEAFAFPLSPGANQSLQRSPETGAWLPAFSLAPTPQKSAGCVLPPPASAASAGAASVLLHEIFARPTKGDEEFIELWNSGPEPVELQGWMLTDASKSGRYVFPETLLAPGNYLVLRKSVFKFALNDTQETLSLWRPDGSLADQAIYQKTRLGISLNQTPAGWRGATPTPGAANAANALPETKERVPKKGFRDIPVEFQARAKDADGSRIKVTWEFGDGRKSYKEKTRHAYRKAGKYTVKLITQDDKDETVETFRIEIRKYEAPKLRITALMPNPAGKDTEGEWVRIENRSKKPVSLAGWSVATGAGSKKIVNHPLKTEPEIAPGDSLTLTREDSLITLPNQKGRVELRAPNGEVVDKVRYAYGKSIPEELSYQLDADKKWQWEALDPTQETAPQIAATLSVEQGDPSETIEDAPDPGNAAILGRNTEADAALKAKLGPLFQVRPFAALPLDAPPVPAQTVTQKDPLGSFHSLVNASLNRWRFGD